MAMSGTGQAGQRNDTQQMPDTTVSASAPKSSGAPAGPGGSPGAAAIVIRPDGQGGYVAEAMTKAGISAPQTFQNYYDLEQWVGQQFGVSPDDMQGGEPSDQGDGGGDEGGDQASAGGNADQSAAASTPGPDEQTANGS